MKKGLMKTPTARKSLISKASTRRSTNVQVTKVPGQNSFMQTSLSSASVANSNNQFMCDSRRGSHNNMAAPAKIIGVPISAVRTSTGLRESRPRAS